MIGVDRGTDGEYGGHDEPERGAGQMVSQQVRADDDAKNPAQRLIIQWGDGIKNTLNIALFIPFYHPIQGILVLA
ncbi:hypothetical protein PSI15_18130 [Xenorhabdus sp. PR6a]|uniref:hypothetical protein n=1 Tax=Xenorhabdus sp. PR6a TaxID=3025877 RepID=UPI00235A0C66|nr:hypothetical protein [Xenorhabdus sp. PR6a]MDC9583423.1 hypothetical protein [Xenorhabdus sp. PR6a]